MKRRILAELLRFRGIPEQVERLYGERAAAIRRAHERGAGVSEIASALSIPRSVVYRALEKEDQ